jgi:hypothetical protein
MLPLSFAAMTAPASAQSLVSWPCSMSAAGVHVLSQVGLCFCQQGLETYALLLQCWGPGPSQPR